MKKNQSQRFETEWHIQGHGVITLTATGDDTVLAIGETLADLTDSSLRKLEKLGAKND